MPSQKWTPYLLVITIAVVALLWMRQSNDTAWLNEPLPTETTGPIIFEVENGETGKSVAKHLEKAGLVPGWRKVVSYLKNNDLSTAIKAGRFVLQSDMTPLEILTTLTQGGGEVAVTIPEGWTLRQIDDRIAGLKLSPDESFATCATTCPLATKFPFLKNLTTVEGYLFPDTFFVDAASFTNENFLSRLLSNFEKKVLTPKTESTLVDTKRTLNDVIIMASIVEREAFLDEDYPVIAGILWKRLDSGWALDADATLLYVLDSPDDLVKNLDMDSPYNTRKTRGLPPTPIGNPGLNAIDAALNPESSPYWFYLNDQETGKAHYAVTNEEHNANKEKWLQ